MNPLLVGSCKQTKLNEQSRSSIQTNAGTSVIVRNNGNSTNKSRMVKKISEETEVQHENEHSLAGCTKEQLSKTYERVLDGIMLNPEGEYFKKLFHIDKHVLEQAKANRGKISFPSDYITRYKTIIDSVGVQFLRIFFPDFSLISLQKIASSTSKTLLALMTGLDQCFHHSSLLDQIQHFPCSSALGNFLKNAVPEMDQVNAVPLEAFEIMTSPWASNIEDEEFVAEIFNQLVKLVFGDREIMKFLTLLALFSPVNIQLTAEETFGLKQFQSKISMLAYNHVLGQESVENASALEWVGKIGRMVEDLHKVREIFTEGVIYHDEADNVENIDDIDIYQI